MHQCVRGAQFGGEHEQRCLRLCAEFCCGEHFQREHIADHVVLMHDLKARLAESQVATKAVHVWLAVRACESRAGIITHREDELASEHYGLDCGGDKKIRRKAKLLRVCLNGEEVVLESCRHGSRSCTSYSLIIGILTKFCE